MIDIHQVAREHDKDMLIAGFQHDLAKAKAEIMRLKAALRGLVDMLHETPPGHFKEVDRARAALAQREGKP